MKVIRKISTAVLIVCIATGSNAASLNSVMDGMFANVTSPNYVSTQLRGSISGGSIYIRSPVSNIQPFVIDPPRISAGCGGIDLYLGSFSFITAEKLTQFMRSVAQNAAPLAFKMALNSITPMLGNVLDKFQQMAQDMNKQQADSCAMAHGFLDGAKSPEEVFGRVASSTTAAIDSAKGWAEGFFGAVTANQDQPSKEAAKVQGLKTADGKAAVPNQGNITWNALQSTRSSVATLNITDDDTISKQLIMTMIGTRIIGQPGATDTDVTKSPQHPWKLRLSQLINPKKDSTGAVSVPMYSCGTDLNNCLSPTSSSFVTYGVKGYVYKMMYGSETATSPQAGSIAQNLLVCSTASCSLSVSQLNFLNSLSKIPTVALLKRAQKQSSVFKLILPHLVDDMVVEVGSVYGQAVLSLVVSTYSGSNIPKPDDYSAALQNIINDLMEYEKQSTKNIERLNAEMSYIDSSLRTFRPAMVYAR